MDFNTSKVRLEGRRRSATAFKQADFNTSKVRLEAVRVARDEKEQAHFNTSKVRLEVAGRLLRKPEGFPGFQYLKGAIGSVDLQDM